MNLRFIALLTFVVTPSAPLLADIDRCSDFVFTGEEPDTELPDEHYELVVETRDGIVEVEIIVPIDSEGWIFEQILVATAGSWDTGPTDAIPLCTVVESESTRTAVFWLDPSEYEKAIIFVVFSHPRVTDSNQCIEKMTTYSVKLPAK